MQSGGGGGGRGHRRRSTSVWDTPTMLPPMEPALCDKLRGLRRVVEFCAGHFELDGIVTLTKKAYELTAQLGNDKIDLNHRLKKAEKIMKEKGVPLYHADQCMYGLETWGS